MRRKKRKKWWILCECPFLKYLLRWHAKRCTTIKSVHSIERRCLPTSFSDKSPHRWDLNFFWTSVPMFSLLNFLSRSPLGPMENVFRSCHISRKEGRPPNRAGQWYIGKVILLVRTSMSSLLYCCSSIDISHTLNNLPLAFNKSCPQDTMERFLIFHVLPSSLIMLSNVT